MKSEAQDHPKIRLLIRELQAPELCGPWAGAVAVGILEALWLFAAKYAPHGDVGRFSDEEIATAVGWPSSREPSELLDVLVRRRWLDSSSEVRYIIHDWGDHCPDYVHRRVARSGRNFADGSPPNLMYCTRSEREKYARGTGDKNETKEHEVFTNTTCSTHEVVPNPTQPNPTTDLRKTSSARKGVDTVARAPESPSLPAMADDDGYTALRCAIEALIPAHTYTADDWAIGYQHWLRLDPEQRQTAAANYAARIAANGDDLTYLKPQLILRGREWQRRPAPPRQNGRRAQAEAELDAMIAAAEREEAR